MGDWRSSRDLSVHALAVWENGVLLTLRRVQSEYRDLSALSGIGRESVEYEICAIGLLVALKCTQSELLSASA